MEELFLKLSLVDHESELLAKIDDFLKFSSWLIKTVLLNRILDTVYLKEAVNRCSSIIKPFKLKNTCKVYNFEILSIMKDSVFKHCVRFCILVIFLEVNHYSQCNDNRDIILRTKNMLDIIVSCKKLFDCSEITKEINKLIKYLVDYIATINLNMLQNQV